MREKIGEKCANALKGSMSAPAEALKKFWEDLLDKSRVRIEHPDLPESLKTAAGDLVASLWSTAQGAAQEGLAALRSEAQAQVAETKQAQSAAEADRDTARASHSLVSETLEQSHARIGELEQAVASRDATIVALEIQLQNARSENAGLLQKLDDARRDFWLELEKLRAAASRLHKEMGGLRLSAEQTAERHRAELAILQEQLGNYRQRAGELEGNLKAVTASRDMAVDDLKVARALLDDKHAQQARAESLVAELRTQLARAPRKPNTTSE